MNSKVDKEPFFTILTASLNNSATIKSLIESVLNQSFQNLEHIIIDGGSCDETPDILKEYERTYNLSWLSEPDDGIADALNKGLKRASGRYILVLQGDDRLLTHDTLASLHPMLQEEKYDIYSFPVIMDRHDRGKETLYPFRILWWNRFKSILLHQGSFIHRRLYDSIGGYRKEFAIAMDYDFFYRALLNHCTLQFGTFPVALMAGTGIGSSNKFLVKRLKEESMVQKLNEENALWKLAQLFFQTLYFPYKTRLLPLLRRPMD